MKAIALIAPLAFALAAAPLGETSAEPAKAKKQTTARAQKDKRAASQPKIACTFFGCTQIPANCRPETGYNWDGMPTGFDVIACR